MGKKRILEEVRALGLTKQHLTILYARPRKLRRTFAKIVPDIADAVRDHIAFLDSSFIQARSGGVRTNSFYYLAANIKLYVEVFDKAAGFVTHNPANHAIQINIFSDNEQNVRGIANVVNSIWADSDGLLAHMDWKRIEKKFKVKREDCIAAWKALLN